MNIPDLMAERGLPWDAMAEKSVLGAILMDSRALEVAQGELSPDDFHLDSHRKIYGAMLATGAQGENFDYISVGAALEAEGHLEDVGGYAYLVSLTDGIPRSIVLANYVRTVREMAARRLAIAYAAEVSRQAIERRGLDDLRKSIQGALDVIDRAVPVPQSRMFVGGRAFLNTTPSNVDWIIRNVIPARMNGVIAGGPKASKSLAVLVALYSIAYGIPWLGFDVPKRRRSAYVSREDAKWLTQRRLYRIMAHHFEMDGITADDLDDWILFMTREERKVWKLDNPRDVRELIAELKDFGPELLVLDVFNRLHDGNENDAGEMTKVLGNATRIADEVGCAVGLIHHFGKDESRQLTPRMRGSSALPGWYEWCIGITLEDVETQLRRMEFETKMGSLAPIRYRINPPAGAPEAEYGPLWLTRVEGEAVAASAAAGAGWRGGFRR